MDLFVSFDKCYYSSGFNSKFWFRARKVIGTFEKRAPATFVGVWKCYNSLSNDMLLSGEVPELCKDRQGETLSKELYRGKLKKKIKELYKPHD